MAMTEEEFGDIGKVAHDLTGLRHGNDGAVAIRVCIHRAHLAGIQRLEHVLSDVAFDPVGASEDTGFCNLAVCKCQNDFIRKLFDCFQALAELDVLERYEAGHDF